MSIKKQLIKYMMERLDDSIKTEVNKELLNFSNTLTNFNNVNLSQIKSILSKRGLILVDGGNEITDLNITLTPTENTKSYSVVNRNNKINELGEGERYSTEDADTLSIRRNENQNREQSILITLY